MNLFKQNYLKFNVTSVIAASFFFSSLVSSSVNAADISKEDYMEGYKERRKKIEEMYRGELAQTEAKFDDALSPADKLKIISKPIHINVDKYENEYFGLPDTRGLSLAICMGNVDLTRKFLSAVTDINADSLDTLGWRQPYTMAHLSLHPHFPHFKDVKIEDRLAIIDLIASKGGDFTLVRTGKADYEWDPMDFHPCVSTNYLSHEDSILIQARGLLYGGAPLAGRLDATEIIFDTKRYNDYYSKLYRICISMYLELEDKTDAMKPTTHTTNIANEELARHYRENGNGAPFIP